MKTIVPLGIGLIFFLMACRTNAPVPLSQGMGQATPTNIQEELMWRRPDPSPEWVLKGHCPDDEQFLCFIGHSSKHVEERRALHEAKVDATNKFVEYCGMEVEVFNEYLETTTGQTSSVLDSAVQSSFSSTQQSNAYVSRIKVSERFIEYFKRTQGGTTFPNVYKIVVKVRVPRDEYNRVQAWKQQRKAKQQKEARVAQVDSEIRQFIETALALKKQGQILAALRQLKHARHTVNESNLFSKNVHLSHIAREESVLVGQLQIQNDSQPILQVEPGEIPTPLAVQVTYRTEAITKPVADFPLAFRHKENKVIRTSDTHGKAIWQLPAYSLEDSFDVEVVPDQDRLASLISPAAWESLSTKQVVFTIRVQKTQLTMLEKTIQSPVVSDFHASLAMEPAQKNWKTGETITLYAKCEQRCYFRIYHLDEQGQIQVLEDSKGRRLPKNREAPVFKATLTTPGNSRMIATFSTDRFSNDYETNVPISVEDFVALLKSFRLSDGAKAEIHKEIVIKP